MKLIPYDPTRCIETLGDAALYLSIGFEEPDGADHRDALHVVARALGKADLAECIQGEGELRLGELQEALRELGLRLVVEVAGKDTFPAR